MPNLIYYIMLIHFFLIMILVDFNIKLEFFIYFSVLYKNRFGSYNLVNSLSNNLTLSVFIDHLEPAAMK